MVASTVSILAIAASALLLQTATAAPVDARDKDHWDSFLEPYETYHERYLSWKCSKQQGTTYFASCCWPIPSTKTVSEMFDLTYCGVWGPPATSTAASSDAAAVDAVDAVVDPVTSDEASIVSAIEPMAFTTSIAQSDVSSASPDAVQQAVNDGQNNNDDATLTTSSDPAPSSSSEEQPAATSSADTGNSNSGSGTWLSGQVTFFYQNGVAGACGTVHQDTDMIAAVHPDAWANGANCGNTIIITNPETNVQISVKVADLCPTCLGLTHIDLSVAAFSQLGTLDQGVVQTEENFGSCILN